MSRVVQPVNAAPSADTWFNLFDKLNAVIDITANNTVTVGPTANGDVSVGNGMVVGVFAANVIAASTLRGGNVQTSGVMNVASNTNFSGAQINIASNVYVTGANVTINTGNMNVTGNTTLGPNGSLTIFSTIGANVNVNATLINVSSNVTFSGIVQFIGTSNVNFGNNTLFIDVPDKRVGINTSTPTVDLTVNGSLSVSNGYIQGPFNQNVITYTNSNTSSQTVDSFPISSFRSGKYLIQISDNSANRRTVTEVLVLQDGANVYMTEYGTISSNGSLGTFSTSISGNNVLLTYTPVSANSTIYLYRTLFAV